MGFRVHVWIYADRDRGPLARLGCEVLDAAELAGRFDVEAQDAGAQGQADLVRRLADSGEHHLAGIAARGDHPLQLAAGNDVEARPKPGEHVEDGEVRVRLHRVAYEVIAADEGSAERTERGLERRARVDIARCPEAARDVSERHRLRMQLTVPEGERTHAATSSSRRPRPRLPAAASRVHPWCRRQRA